MPLDLKLLFYLMARDWGLPAGFDSASVETEALPWIRCNRAHPPNADQTQLLATSNDVVDRQLDVAQDRSKKAWPNRLTCMYWYSGDSPVHMAQK
jgi:hypothetical protein